MNTRYTKKQRIFPKMNKKVIVVGAGASGLMAAGTAAKTVTT